MTDTLTNQAEEEVEAQWGQHVTVGEPFLTSNCRLDMADADHFVPPRGGDRLQDDDKGTWPNSIDPAGNPVDLSSFPPKSDRLQDYSVFKNQEEGWYAVTNPDRGVGFGLAYPVDTFK